MKVILHDGLESGNNKQFWKYVKSPKQETFGNTDLKSNGNVITYILSKAEILNSQFKSGFPPHSGNKFPQLPGTQCPKIKPEMVFSCYWTGLMYQCHLDQTSFREDYCSV